MKLLIGRTYAKTAREKNVDYVCSIKLLKVKTLLKLGYDTTPSILDKRISRKDREQLDSISLLKLTLLCLEFICGTA